MHLITSQHLPLNCICVFKASSSFFPRHLQPLASLSRFFFIFPISSPFCRRSLNFLIVSNSFHFSCVCPFPPSVEVVPPPVLPAPDGVFYSVNFLMNVAVSQLFYCLPSEWGMAIFFTQATPSILRREQSQARNSATTAAQVDMSQCLQIQWPINHQSTPKTQGDTAGPSMALVTDHTKGFWHVCWLTLMYHRAVGSFTRIPCCSCKPSCFSPSHSLCTVLIGVAVRDSIERQQLGRINRCSQQVQC